MCCASTFVAYTCLATRTCTLRGVRSGSALRYFSVSISRTATSISPERGTRSWGDQLLMISR